MSGDVSTRFTPAPIQRLSSLIVVTAGSALMAGMCIWAVTSEPTHADAALVALGAFLASQLLLYRTLGACVVVDASSVFLFGQIRTRRIEWCEIESLQISGWFGGPALFITTTQNRRFLVPLIMRRQRFGDLEEFRDAILGAGRSRGARTPRVN
jgi:hypothetical protein